MALWVGIRGVPTEDGDYCPVFNPAVWWKPWEIWKDPRFRVVDPIYYRAIACLEREEMQDFQQRFQHYAKITDHWKDDSDRLDQYLNDPKMSGRLWVVTIYEWESGID